MCHKNQTNTSSSSFQLYNSLWVLACSIISFHCFLSCFLCFQLVTLHLPQFIPHIVLPSYFWPSLRSCCIRFPFVYGLSHSFVSHSFYMPQPAQSFVFYVSYYMFVINCFSQFSIIFRAIFFCPTTVIFCKVINNKRWLCLFQSTPRGPAAS